MDNNARDIYNKVIYELEDKLDEIKTDKELSYLTSLRLDEENARLKHEHQLLIKEQCKLQKTYIDNLKIMISNNKKIIDDMDKKEEELIQYINKIIQESDNNKRDEYLTKCCQINIQIKELRGSLKFI